MPGPAPQSGNAAAPDLAEIDRCIHLFGESIRHFFRDQQRSSMTSPMFNLPGRLVLGSHCYHEHLPALLGAIRARAGEAEIGRGMKRLCSRPNYVHLNSLALGYLVGREQARLTGQKNGDDAAGAASVMGFWSNVARNYRNDQLLLPDQAGFSIPILEQDLLADLERQLRDDLAPDFRRRIRRMLATLELYTFILHGEARVGVFHHGPYPLENGDSIVIRELIGLREDFYPWARLQTRPRYDHLAWVIRLRDVKAKIVLFGSLATQPADFAARVVAEAMFAVENGAFQPLPDTAVDELTANAGDAQLELYRRVIDWDDRYRIAYGADLYACLLKTFADQQGFGNSFGQQIRERFASTIDKHLEDLHSGREPPLVLQHIASTEGPIFAPLDPDAGAAP